MDEDGEKMMVMRKSWIDFSKSVLLMNVSKVSTAGKEMARFLQVNDFLRFEKFLDFSLTEKES